MENITKKEFWLGICVTLVALSIAIFVEPFIKDGMMNEIKVYQQALRVDNNLDMFSYAQKTNVGNVLAFGEIEALEPQKIDDLQESYMAIQKVKEHYTMKTKQVSHESCSGSGKDKACTTYYTTEIYYEWDVVQRWNYIGGRYNFLGVVFVYDQLRMPSYQRLELNDKTMNSKYSGFYDKWNLYERISFGYPSGDDRYYFEVLPIKFATTIFVKFLNDKTSDPFTGSSNIAVIASQTPDQIIQQKKDGLVIFDWIYYTLIIVITCVLWFWFAYSVLEIF